MSPKKPVLRWRKREQETGLASIYNRDDECDLWYGDERVASAGPLFQGFDRHNVLGYYWSAGSFSELGITHRNTCAHPVKTLEEAKSAARGYIEQCLVQKGLRKR